MRKYIQFSLICFLIFSCKQDKKQIKLIEFYKMKLVVWQLMKADEFYIRSSVGDSTVKTNKKNVQYYQQIFNLNNIDRTDFYKNIEYYESHPIEFKVLMDSVNELSKREKNIIKPI